MPHKTKFHDPATITYGPGSTRGTPSTGGVSVRDSKALKAGKKELKDLKREYNEIVGKYDGASPQMQNQMGDRGLLLIQRQEELKGYQKLQKKLIQKDINANKMLGGTPSPAKAADALPPNALKGTVKGQKKLTDLNRKQYEAAQDFKKRMAGEYPNQQVVFTNTKPLRNRTSGKLMSRAEQESYWANAGRADTKPSGKTGLFTHNADDAYHAGYGEQMNAVVLKDGVPVRPRKLPVKGEVWDSTENFISQDEIESVSTIWDAINDYL